MPGTELTKRKHGLLNILYPRCCPVCHRILSDQTSLVCGDCAQNLPFIRSPFCMKCGTPVAQGEEYCRDCRRSEHVFDCGRGVFLYNETWKKSIEKYKYYGCREYGDFYAELMARCALGDRRIRRTDLVVPVPLHERKKRIRGFNQSWYLAARIAGKMGIPATETAVVKVRETRSQKKLSLSERRRNLSAAYEVTEPLTGRSVLVVDDIFTTGSTMDAMAEILYRAGADRVCFLTFCVVPAA